MIRNMSKVLVFTAFAVLTHGTAFAQTSPEWELVYKHDPYGLPLAGSLSDLVAAVENGHDIKIVLHDTGGYKRQILFTDLIVNPSKTEVIGYAYMNVSNPTNTDVYLRHLSYSTSGENTISYAQNPDYQYWVWHYSMSWYARK